MELTKEKNDKIIEQYLKQRDYAKIYYQKYQKDIKDKINAYNIEKYHKNKERILLQKKEYYKRKKQEKEEANKNQVIIE
jgi:hypothetical protein